MIIKVLKDDALLLSFPFQSMIVFHFTIRILYGHSLGVFLLSSVIVITMTTA